MSNQYTWMADTYPTLDTSGLAAKAAQAAALSPMSLEQFFVAVVAQGGGPGELARLWVYQQYIAWANDALNAGDYGRVLALIATMPETLNETTQTAIAAVVAGATISHGDVAATRMGMPSVAGWSAETIANELDSAGYEWNDGRWVAPINEIETEI